MPTLLVTLFQKIAIRSVFWHCIKTGLSELSNMSEDPSRNELLVSLNICVEVQT